MIAAPDGLYGVLSAAVARRMLEPNKRRGAVAFEVFRERNVSKFLSSEGIEGARGIPVIPGFVADGV
jgi:hypothetical protein